MNSKNTLAELREKYEVLGENPNKHLEGLLQAKPINYWDYTSVDTLLTLQKTRTDFPDETIFITYHQITELTLKLIIHELQQLTGPNDLEETSMIEKISRLPRYTEMLMTSFDVMRQGMDYNQYSNFRKALTPASGFQSAQFRYLEIYSTPLSNLVHGKGKERLPKNPSIEDYFEEIYWKDAGFDRKTGEKTLTLRLFEERYLAEFIALGKRVKGNTLADKYAKLNNPSDKLKNALREFDYFYNVKWALVHLETAAYYLDRDGKNKAGTGGSDWKKYLHPKFQQRRFFPSLWSEKEISHWGELDFFEK